MRITTNLHVIISCFLFLLIMSEGVNAQMQVSPEGLTCEYLRQPGDAVITDSIPKFSWIFPREGRSQQAYRILVSSNLWTLKEGHADLWDSGIIKSSSSINIKYNGKSLISNQSFWWKVKVWTTDADSSYYSDAQMVNLGDLFRKNLDYPGQSRWIEVAADQWVSEDRQCAHFSTIGPDTMLKNSEGNYFVQFPRAAFGTLAFTAFAKDAQKIKVFLGERNLGEEVHKDPGVSNIGFVELEMNLEKGLHSYVVRLPDRPKSHYLHSQKLAEHYPEVIPFRFAELIFDQQIVEVLSVEQKALFYYFDDDASRFICSDDRLQRIWDLCKYTLKATPFLGVYADGNRERMPYEADAYIQQLGHYSVDREYAIGRYTLNFLFDHASWPTEWQMHTVLMAWQHYMYTGDLDLFVSRYDDLKRKSLYQLAESNGLISTRLGKKTRAFLDSLNFPGKEDQFRDIVDWPQGPPPGKEAQNNQSPVPGGETDGYVFTDFNTVVNAYHNRCLVIMSEIAGLVGKTEDAQFFRKQADKHKQAFLETFFDAESGLFRDGDATQHSSLHANMFALVFDLVPEGGIDRVVAFIKSRGMACSVYGAQFLLEALFNAGESQYALDLITNDTKRGWLNMLRVGATMTTEAWDEYYKPNLTWNHAWGASPANIIVRKLFGIEPLEAGFSSFVLKPQPGSLKDLQIKAPTIRGSISCSLHVEDAQWNLHVSVPGNTTGYLVLPNPNKILVNDVSVIVENTVDKGIRLPAGEYEIICSLN